MGTVLAFVALYSGTFYVRLDEGSSQTYGREGHADCKKHVELLSSSMRGQVRGDRVRASPQEDVDVRVNASGMYESSRVGTSASPTFAPVGFE